MGYLAHHNTFCQKWSREDCNVSQQAGTQPLRWDSLAKAECVSGTPPKLPGPAVSNPPLALQSSPKPVYPYYTKNDYNTR
jgi:hypothetical protein